MSAVAIRDPAEAPQRLPAHIQAMTPVDMLSVAVTNGASIEILERLITLQERWRAGEARRAFDAAIAAAKADIKPIPKTRNVGFSSGKGSTNYDYEGLDDIANMVDPALARNGLSYRHRALQDGNNLKITCVLTHKDGHFEETTLGANNDQSGNKNAIQAVGSVATYLQRYTLKLALGLATTRDNDAQGSGARQARPGSVAPATRWRDGAPSDAPDDFEDAPDEPAVLSAEQVEHLVALADEVGADKAKFCQWLGVSIFSEIPASQFDRAVRALEAKRRQAQQSHPGAEPPSPAETPADALAAGAPASPSQAPAGGDAGHVSEDEQPSPEDEARRAGRKACREGKGMESIPPKIARYSRMKAAWEEGYQSEGELMEAEMNQ